VETRNIEALYKYGPHYTPPQPDKMNRKCYQCGLANYKTAQNCIRYGSGLGESVNISSNRGFLNSPIVRRVAICLMVILAAVAGFYGSLVLFASPLDTEQRRTVDAAIAHLERSGFSREAFLLRHLTVYRSNDNWLNASVEKENAYAATNFPFEIITLYPDFFRYPVDDTERAAILLHEAQHLKGSNETDAYEFVWKNRKQVGWVSDPYNKSVIWRETRKMTKEYIPTMFVCELNSYSDCTE
jgi:hypothetical protein